MRTALKIGATVAAFGIFYLAAFFIMNGAKDFEKRGEMALFTNKTEAAAIANAESQEQKPAVSVSGSVWK